MIALLNWRLWVAVGFLALLPILYMKGRSDGTKLERLAVAVARAQADNDARALERRRQDRLAEAQRSAASREARIVADASGARDAVSGMRDTLDAVERASAQSFDAARESVAALRVVFGQCTGRYQAVAEAADRHANDSLKLQQAWPE